MKTINQLVSRPSFFLALCLVAASILPSPAAASYPDSYPVLPDLPGADISGQARIVIDLEQGIALVEVEGQLYALDDRPLEVAFDDLERITLLFVVPKDAGVFVTEDGLWTRELEPSRLSTLLAFDLFDAFEAGALSPSETEEFGFQIALPGQPAPTIPDVVIRPTEDDPDPT
jgi:hypothetical protein